MSKERSKSFERDATIIRIQGIVVIILLLMIAIDRMEKLDTDASEKAKSITQESSLTQYAMPAGN